MAKKPTEPVCVKGDATHRRTENDYMATLVETVTLDDWRELVKGALRAAKQGDPHARNWLGRYLVGKPESKAPSPMTVVVQQLSGTDPLVESLAAPHLSRMKSANIFFDDDMEETFKRQAARELADKMRESRDGLDNPAVPGTENTGESGE